MKTSQFWKLNVSFKDQFNSFISNIFFLFCFQSKSELCLSKYNFMSMITINKKNKTKQNKTV